MTSGLLCPSADFDQLQVLDLMPFACRARSPSAIHTALTAPSAEEVGVHALLGGMRLQCVLYTAAAALYPDPAATYTVCQKLHI